jgi:hypothetical protein
MNAAELKMEIDAHLQAVVRLREELARVEGRESRTIEFLLVAILTKARIAMTSNEIFDQLKCFPEGTEIKKASFQVQLSKYVKKGTKIVQRKLRLPIREARALIGLQSWDDAIWDEFVAKRDEFVSGSRNEYFK